MDQVSAANADAPMHDVPRCGAKDRAGMPCQNPPMKDRQRCRIHGGLSPGAPKGVANGRYTDGYWTREAVEERKFIRSLLKSWPKHGDEVMTPPKKFPATSRAARRSPPARMRIKGIQGNVVSFASPGPADRIWREQLKTTLGTVSEAFVDMALQHLERAARMPGDGASDVSINGALAIIAAFAPRNEAEAAVALQAACTHMVAMVMMARIGGGHGGDRRLPALASAAAKLMRAHCLQVETYRRLRGGGDQHIRVEHVHVHEGGQAIVGVVTSPVRHGPK